LNEVSRETGSILDVEETAATWPPRQTKRVIDYQILSIMLYDEEQKSISSSRGCETRAAGAGENCAWAATEGIVGGGGRR